MPFWRKKEKRAPDDDPFNLFRSFFSEDIFKEMEKMQKEMIERFSEFETDEEEMKKMEELSRRSGGKPVVYGFSLKLGPGGKPVFEQFGNVEPVEKEIKQEREPLVDVIHKEMEISVLAELPGVEKNELKLSVTPDKKHLEINVPNKFYKKLALPATVKPDVSKATYKNGVLEVTLQKERPSPPEKGTRIPVE